MPLTSSGGTVWNCTWPTQRMAVASSTRMAPGPAVPISRADRFTRSPITVYSRRTWLPTTPQKVSPVVMPMWVVILLVLVLVLVLAVDDDDDLAPPPPPPPPP